MANANTASNSVLASIFVLSLLMMFLIPFTLCGIAWRWCGARLTRRVPQAPPLQSPQVEAGRREAFERHGVAVGTCSRCPGAPLSCRVRSFHALRAAPRGAQAVKQRSGRSSAGAGGVFTFGACGLRARLGANTHAPARRQATSPSCCSGSLRLGSSCTSGARPRRCASDARAVPPVAH